MIAPDSPGINPYPTCFGLLDPAYRTTQRRRDEVMYLTAFYGEPVCSLDHNTGCDTLEQQLASVGLGRIVTTVVTVPANLLRQTEGGQL